MADFDFQPAPEIIRSTGLAGIPHGFLTAMPGEDQPDPGLILPGARLVLLDQIHSSTAITVDAPPGGAERAQADGMATATRGLVLGIRTADCAPILLADPVAGVVAAAHAGWRGALYGVIEATVRRMEERGATRAGIRAVIGPTIAQANYEVGWDMCEKFEDRNARFFKRGRPGKWLFDLPAYVQSRLESLGLGHIESLGLDTYADEQRFHSYRRATHRGSDRSGRQYSLISLPE